MPFDDIDDIINFLDKHYDGQTALIWAARNNDIDIVELLVNF